MTVEEEIKELLSDVKDEIFFTWNLKLGAVILTILHKVLVTYTRFLDKRYTKFNKDDYLYKGGE